MEDYQIALNKAKIAVMSKDDFVFLSTVMLSLQFKWDDAQPTAYTNGTVIGINPTFFMEQLPDVRISVLIHETLHVAFIHMDRLMERNMNLFNIAADHVINLVIKERGLPVPASWYCDDKYKGMSTEEVYELLKKAPPPPGGDGMAPPPMQDLRPAEMPSPELVEHIKDILARAQTQAKMAGNTPGSIPGDIQVYLDKLLNPKLPWFSILRKYINSLSKNNYSFRKPNRRHFPQYYLPSLIGEKLMDIAIAVDTSGSVSDSDFNSFVSEVNGVFKMMRPNKITLIQFDTAIKSVTQIKDMRDIMATKFVGRGGTRIGPVMQWAAENKPGLLMVFTDGEFRFYDSPPTIKSPLLWLIHNNDSFEAPIGKVIHYELV